MPRQMFNLGSGLGSALFGDPSVMMDAQMKAAQMQAEQNYRDQQLALQREQEARLAAQARQAQEAEAARLGIAQQELGLRQRGDDRAQQEFEINQVRARQERDRQEAGYGAAGTFGEAFANLHNSQGALNKAVAADQAYVPSAATVRQYDREGVDTNVPSYEALNVIPGARRAVEEARPAYISAYGGMISAAPDVATASKLAIDAASPEAGITAPWQNARPLPAPPRPYESTGEKLAQQRADETYVRIRNAGIGAADTRSNIALLREATKGVNTGPAAPYMAAFGGVMRQIGLDPAALGLDPNLSTVGDMLKTFNAKFVTDALASGKFPTQNFSNADKVFLQQMFPDIADTPLGMEIKLEIFDRMAQADQRKLVALKEFVESGQGDAADFEEMWALTADQRPDMFGDLAQRVAAANRTGGAGALPPAQPYAPTPGPGLAPPPVRGAAPMVPGAAPNRASAYQSQTAGQPRILDIRVVE